MIRSLASIVVNNFNYGRYVQAAVRSALEQTWPATEVVVVDDGSTDGSPELLKSFGDRIRLVCKENGGQGSAFNAGFAASRGDVVMFLDADDLLAPHAVACLMGAPWGRIAKAHGRLARIDAEGNVLPGVLPDGPMIQGDCRERAIREGPLYDAHAVPPTTGNAWSREFLARVLPMPEADWDHGADVYLHSLAPVHGALQAVEEVLGAYRIHGRNHYCRAPLTEGRIDEYLGRFAAASRALARDLRAQGVAIGAPDDWRHVSFNALWLERLKRARRDLASLVPAGEPILLIDEAEWGDPGSLEGRRLIPVPEEAGHWAGRPSGSRELKEAILRHYEEGVRHLAVWWTAAWWLDEYPDFAQWLYERGDVLVRGDHLMLIRLRGESG